MSVLVVGATGMLGREICRALREEGLRVRGLVREGSEGEDVVRSLGVEIVRGDLKDRASLRAACSGMSTVISTANSILRRRRGDSVWSVDRDGHLSLIAEAREAGVARFVFISVDPRTTSRAPFIRCKRLVEAAVRRSGMTWTILQPAPFMEVYFSPRAGWDLAAGRVSLIGTGRVRRSFISLMDVAQYASLALKLPDLENRDLMLGGPQAISALDAVRAFEEVTGRRLAVTRVPVAVPRLMGVLLRPFQPSLSSLMRLAADGGSRDEITDMGPVLDRFRPGRPLTSVHDYARRIGLEADGAGAVSH